MDEERCFNNWDLDAVVRLACRRRLSAPPSQVNDPFDSFPPAQQGLPAAPNPANEADVEWRFPDLRADGGQDSDELLRALLVAQPAMPPPALPTLPTPPPLPQQQQQQPPAVLPPAEVPAQARAAPASAPARAQPSGRMPGAVPRSKRRKNQVKKVVCHVPADSSSSDVWAWRKYGQKPIKGSPYPRGYYRCSSSKGCAARKQVERCRTDPNTFILTYTGEHNHAAPTHRNSLAGTTRHKFPPSTAQPPPPSVVVVGSSSESQQHQQPSPSAPSASAGLSPTTPLRTPSMEEDDEDEDELLVEDMEMAGVDELLFLNGDADSASPMPSLFDIVDEPFLASPWATATAGSPAAGAAGAGS